MARHAYKMPEYFRQAFSRRIFPFPCARRKQCKNKKPPLSEKKNGQQRRNGRPEIASPVSASNAVSAHRRE
jgi:hypothetical protein